MFIKGALEIILNGSLVYSGCLLIEKAMGDWGLFIHLSPLNWFLSHAHMNSRLQTVAFQHWRRGLDDFQTCRFSICVEKS